MNKKETLHFLRQILQSKVDNHKKLYTLYTFFTDSFSAASEMSKLYFGTLFSRMAFVLAENEISTEIKFHLHHFRIEAEKLLGDHSNNVPDTLIEEGVWALASFLEVVFKVEYVHNLSFQHYIPNQPFKKPTQSLSFIRNVKVVVLGFGSSKNYLRAINPNFPDEEQIINIGVVGRNDIFISDIKAAVLINGFPFQLNLVDVEIAEDGFYAPKYVILEPDFLIDVSTVANCFRDQKSPAKLSLLNKYLTIENAVPIMLGHIANYFLDALIYQPDITFKEVFPNVFHLNPLGFSIMPDEDVRKIMEASQIHFDNLQQVVKQGLGSEEINRAECLIEPAFYSPDFGLQGRLDIYYQGKDEKQANIIELKSGKVFMPNNYGLNATHYVQTLLYDLILRGVSEFKKRAKAYILYSGQINKPLRYAPSVDSLQKEAIHARNQLYLNELQMQQMGLNNEVNLLSTISLKNFAGARGFLKTDVEKFEALYSNLSKLEQTYIQTFSGFIARELALSKVGEQGVEKVNGLASLWLDSMAEKQQKYNIFSNIVLLEILTESDDTFVKMAINDAEANVSNFRVGDICVLYPAKELAQPVLRSQIYKCGLIEIQNDQILLKLRNKQIHESELLKEKKWHLEHDVLDSGFTAQYRSLYKLMKFGPLERAAFLGVSPPARKALEVNIPHYPSMHSEQQQVFEKMMKAKDFFLLWGPPGTGKTSIMIRYAVEHLLLNSTQNILLLAYTNRAVDEICYALESIGEQATNTFIRIGSSMGTTDVFKPYLLQNQISGMKTRRDIKALLQQKRIVVSTVSSIIGKSEIFRIKKFDIVIIDEASQILEPMLAGLVPGFVKTILIGDHKQLPAVVTQNSKFTISENASLQRIDLTDLSDSYFERMYRVCKANNWNWAYGQLSYQGRMHQDIMQFVNTHFYEDELKTMNQWQTANEGVQDYLFNKRLCFFNCTIEEEEFYLKTNIAEAKKCAELILKLMAQYQQNNLIWTTETLGVIVPFRAQLAMIRKYLTEAKIDTNLISIDTVERYQGSSRDIIILSTTVNRTSQLSALISANSEGIDRKLNVAITRARKQFIMLGNKNILEKNEVYKAFMTDAEMNNHGVMS